MAITLGDEVALAQSGSDYLARNGSFQFGRANVVAAAVDVVWANGNVSEDVASTNLDKISLAVSALIGRVVTPTEAGSPEYRGVLVRAYTRQNDGAGALTSCFLIALLSNGQLLECTSVTVAPG